MFTRVYALIIKELISVWRDKRSRFVLVVPPMLQMFVFAFAATLDVKNVPIGIVNEDNGEKSFELIERFKGSPFFTKIIELPSVTAAEDFIVNMKGVMVVMFDPQFSRNLDAGKPAEILLMLDGRKSNTTQIVSGYTSSIVDQFNREFAARAGIKLQNTELVIRNWFNPNLIYYWYNIPCLSGILPMMIALVVSSLSVAREKELGTFDQLLVSPITPTEIIIGKMIPALIIGVAEATAILFIGVFLFKIPFVGSIVLLYSALIVFLSAIVGVGLFISSLVQTQQQAVLGTFIFMVPSVLLSGFATPIENMPNWLQPITYLIPLSYYLVITKGLFLKGIDAAIVFHNAWPLAVIAFFTLTGAGWFFRRRLE